MTVELRTWQEDVLNRKDPDGEWTLRTGKILFGGVGSGKSIVALWYYFHRDGSDRLVVITTAKKRDTGEWIADAAKFGIGTRPGSTLAGVLTVDSWNNIGKYVDCEDCFFIFDEQRLVGSGAWVKAFYKIAKKNTWLVLSGTPGDTWMDYIPVFVANGFYRNKTEFCERHVIYRAFARFPQIQSYVDTGRLEKLKRYVLVPMAYDSKNERVEKDIHVEFDDAVMERLVKDRWNIYEDSPIENVSELFACMRRCTFEHSSRIEAINELIHKHNRLIIFYNFNYELDALRELYYGEICEDWEIGEWNGQRKNPVPDSEKWIYLVQYSAGAEGWNCTSTNAICFYSMTYSYRQWEQAHGRIDRMTHWYDHLYYYTLISNSVIDVAIRRALDKKEDFNQVRWMDQQFPNFN